jgi:uncharacterized protein
MESLATRDRSAGRPRPLPWPPAAALALAALAALDAEVSFPEQPAEGVFYVDEAGLVDARTGEEINRIAGAVLADKHVPMLIVTIRSLLDKGAGAYRFERYAAELFDYWGIGSARASRGMLFLISAGDRRVRIELGEAWRRQHDADAQRIIDTLVVPDFRAGDFARGILGGVRGLEAIAREVSLPRPPSSSWLTPLIAVSALGGLAMVMSLFRSRRHGWGWAALALAGASLVFILRAAAAAGSRGSSSGGGSGRFGGGRSGGGGASGSW